MEINDKITITDGDKRNYFEEHREEFKNPERREVREIYIKDEKLANKIASRAKKGENFFKLAKKYNEKASTKQKDGYRGFITKTTQGIGKSAFETKIGGIVGPIKVGRNFSIIKVLSKKEADYKTFEEAQQYVNARIRQEFREKRTKEWMDELREEIDIIIYNHRLEDTFTKAKTG